MYTSPDNIMALKRDMGGYLTHEGQERNIYITLDGIPELKYTLGEIYILVDGK
jgi:hypothetical protein